MAMVVAPMVVATTIDHKVVYLTAGDVVPNNVTPEALEHLRGLGFVTDDDVEPAAPLVTLPKPAPKK